MGDIAAGKKAAAVRAVNDWVKVSAHIKTTVTCPLHVQLPFFQDKHKLGIGSGSTIVYAVERLGLWCNCY